MKKESGLIGMNLTTYMKTVLIISYSSLHRDPRVLRQVQSLKNDYRIITIGDTPILNYDIIHYDNKKTNTNIVQNVFIKIIKLFYLLQNLYRFYPALFEAKLNLKYIISHEIITPDFIIANDWDGLYLASELKKKKSWNVKIYFDAHEYSPKQFSASLKWRLLMQPIIIHALLHCKNDINIMSTVCTGIAGEYEHFFNFPNGFIKIITNAVEYTDTLNPNEIREGIIRIIHHGGAIKERRLELMIDIMKYLNPVKYELTFMLVNSQPKYKNYLLKKSRNYKNIYFIEPVPYSDITSTINKFDIGVFLVKPDNLNYKYALPNKLFEFIQARLAIAIGPSSEMVQVVEHYNLGVHSNDFTPKSLAKAIEQLTPEKIMEYKRNSDKHAKELSAEENIIKIKDIIKELAEV
jgi:hypothetical protein